jgi:hypothetical protein
LAKDLIFVLRKNQFNSKNFQIFQREKKNQIEQENSTSQEGLVFLDSFFQK